MNGLPKTAYTDAAVHVIHGHADASGPLVRSENRRPPMNTGDFRPRPSASFAIQTLHTGGQRVGGRASYPAGRRVARASKAPDDTGPRVPRARPGVANEGSKRAKQSAQALMAMQRPDGGWSQLPETESDAYATGQVLFALATAGQVASTDPVYRKGVDYLLRTQAADGTWHVKSRAIGCSRTSRVGSRTAKTSSSRRRAPPGRLWGSPPRRRRSRPQRR